MDDDLKSWFDKLRQFKMLSTGVPSLDDKIRKAWGDWLTPEEEYRAIKLEIAKSRTLPDKIPKLLAMLEDRIKRGIVSTPDNSKPVYEITSKKIPFNVKDANGNKTDELGFMKLRQVCVWSKAVHDSGKYRITYVRQKLSVICLETGKKIRELKPEEFRKFLSFYFEAEVLENLLSEFWE